MRKAVLPLRLNFIELTLRLLCKLDLPVHRILLLVLHMKILLQSIFNGCCIFLFVHNFFVLNLLYCHLSRRFLFLASSSVAITHFGL